MSIAELDKKLNDAVLSGKAMEAFEELYADDVIMQENADAEFVGKDFNRKREEDFFASVEADGVVEFRGIHSATLRERAEMAAAQAA